MSAAAALGFLLLLAGLGGIGYGFYALLRGGRGQSGGIGPLPERGVHIIAGLRMLAVGVVCLAAGGYLLWSHFG